MNKKETIPLIDLSLLYKDGKEVISKEIHQACKEYGFFYIINHGIEQSLIDKIMNYTQKILSLPKEDKLNWKVGTNSKGDFYGYFSLGEQYTYGIDYKEGHYYNLEENSEYDRSNGKRMYPSPEEEIKYDLIGYKDTFEQYIRELKLLGDRIMELIALSLSLPQDYFVKRYTIDPPLVLACLKYPSFHDIKNDDDDTRLGNGPHTDWGTITLLYQQSTSQSLLQVKSKKTGEWIDATPIHGSFVVNLGDMLEIMTNGYYISNIHRVLYNKSGRDRYSFPFFLSPDNDTPIIPIENCPKVEKPERDSDYLDFRGTYRQYHQKQINKLFNK